MMDFEFAQYVNQYLGHNGYLVRTIAKIGSNPEKSKRFETATTRLFETNVDFANLQNEVYIRKIVIPSEIVDIVYGKYSKIFC